MARQDSTTDSDPSVPFPALSAIADQVQQEPYFLHVAISILSGAAFAYLKPAASGSISILINGITITVALLAVVVSSHLSRMALAEQATSVQQSLERQTQLSLLDRRLSLLDQAIQDYQLVSERTAMRDFRLESLEAAQALFLNKYHHVRLLFDPRIQNYVNHASNALVELGRESGKDWGAVMERGMSSKAEKERQRYLSSMHSVIDYMREQLNLPVAKLDDILFPQEAGIWMGGVPPQAKDSKNP